MKTLRTKAWDVSTKTSDNKPKRIGRISKTSPPVQRMLGWARLDARFESSRRFGDIRATSPTCATFSLGSRSLMLA